jgi:hypothetical protein
MSDVRIPREDASQIAGYRGIIPLPGSFYRGSAPDRCVNVKIEASRLTFASAKPALIVTK